MSTGTTAATVGKQPARKRAIKAAATTEPARSGAPEGGEQPAQTAAAKTPAPRSGSAKKAAAKTSTKKAASPVAKRTTGKAASRKAASPSAGTVAKNPSTIPVGPGDAPWTGEEIAALEAELHVEVARLESELVEAEHHLEQLRSGPGGNSGDDPVDTGAKAYERENELALASHVTETLAQCRHALARLTEGTFGICDGCAQPIAKRRLQAFPRATLCIKCKQREERH